MALRAPASSPQILRLPNEILQELFEIIIYTDKEQMPERPFTSVLAILKTCKKFYSNILPLFYRDPSLAGPLLMAPADIRVTQLHRTLRANPTLRSMCRYLSVNLSVDMTVDGFVHSDSSMGIELLTWLTDLVYLRVSAIYNNPYSWVMIKKAVKSMPKLKDLQLWPYEIIDSREDLRAPEPYCPREPVQLIHNCLTIPSLHSLKLVNPSTAMVPAFGEDLEEMHGEELHPTKQSRIATFTSLEILEPSFDTEAFVHLLSWPRALEHFHITEPCFSSCGPYDYTLNLMERALRPQITTLRSLHLGYFYRRGGRTRFPISESS